jgi:hypothetical protein
MQLIGYVPDLYRIVLISEVVPREFASLKHPQINTFVTYVLQLFINRLCIILISYVPELDRIVLMNKVVPRVFASLKNTRKATITTRVLQVCEASLYVA